LFLYNRFFSFFQTGKNFEKFIFRLIFYHFCIILKYKKNGAGKFIFRCCPRRKRLFARGSKQEFSGAKKRPPGEVDRGSARGRERVRKW